MELLDFLDDISEFVYVVDPHTCKISYLSRGGERLFGLQPGGALGQECDSLLWGETCTFCQGEFLGRERYNPVLGKTYLLKGGRIGWKDGSEKLLVIGFDAAKKRKRAGEIYSDSGADTEKEILLCARELSSSPRFSLSMQRSLMQLGGCIGCDRVYVFEFDGDRASNTHEWCAPGAESLKNRYQGLPRQAAKRWERLFSESRGVVIADAEDVLAVDPEEYAALKKRGARSLVAAPLISENEVIGFLAADNPPAGRTDKTRILFAALSYLYANAIARERLYEKMRRMSYFDSLTGLHNRNSYINDLKKLKKGAPPRSLGVVFLDVNGLKSVNDSLGHEKGDEVLRFVSGKFSEIFGEYKCYRLGGDEFITLCPDIGEEEFSRRTSALREKILSGGHLAAAVGAKWSDAVSDIEEIIAAADKDMYEDKRLHGGENNLVHIFGRREE